MFLSDVDVANRYGVSRTTIWRWRTSDPTFPQPVCFSPGCVRWKVASLEAWEAAKAGDCAPPEDGSAVDRVAARA